MKTKPSMLPVLPPARGLPRPRRNPRGVPRPNHAADETVVVAGPSDHSVDLDRVAALLSAAVGRGTVQATFTARGLAPFKIRIARGDLRTVSRLLTNAGKSPNPIHRVEIVPYTAGGLPIAHNPRRRNLPRRNPSREPFDPTPGGKLFGDTYWLDDDGPCDLFWARYVDGPGFLEMDFGFDAETSRLLYIYALHSRQLRNRRLAASDRQRIRRAMDNIYDLLPREARWT